MDYAKKKILLVDDNEFTRLMFSDIFWLHGLDDECSFFAVKSVAEAMGVIDNPITCPDVVFTGLVMPFENGGKTETSAEAGFSLIEHIKTNPKTAGIHVVVFSNFNEEEYREKASALGAEMYLKKDDNIPADLIRIVHSFDNR